MASRVRSGLGRAASAASEQAVATGFVTGWRAVRLLPERRARALFDRAATRSYRADGSGVRRLRSNLAKVRPDLDEDDLERVVEAGVHSYMRYWCESFRLPSWPLDDLVARTRTSHEDRLREPYAEGRGVIAVLPHQGNWDWAGAWACATGMHVTTVAERLRPERLYDEFVTYRERLGMRILPLTGGEPPLPALADCLRAGGFVCLLADRDLGGVGVEVSMCGHPVRMPAGPAVLARETGAALVPMTLGYVGPDLRLSFHEEVVVESEARGVNAAMQQVADAFTAGLEAHPEDWHMLQRVFLDDPLPPPQRRRAA